MRSAILRMTLGLMAIGAVCLSGQLNTVRADSTTQPASQPTTGPVVITWDDAGKHVGETVTVTGPVKGTHAVGGGKSLILNIGKDYPDKGRLSVMMTGKASEDDYKDVTVTVTGKIEMFKGAAEIKAKVEDVKIEK